jgi:hypothetical protein
MPIAAQATAAAEAAGVAAQHQQAEAGAARERLAAVRHADAAA